MEHYPWLLLALSAMVASAATWGICRWWFGRQLAAASERIDKLDKARQFSSQQVMQARKQIEKLQRERAALPQRPVSNAASPPTRAAQLEAVLRSVDRIPPRAELPASGFADTQTLDKATS